MFKIKTKVKKDVQVLISMPSLNRGPFVETVVLMCEGFLNCDIGLVINKQANEKATKIFANLHSQAKVLDQYNICYGGPVENNYFWVLHSLSKEYESTIPVNFELGFTSMEDIARDIDKKESPELFQLGIGYAGWSEGQLMREIEEGSWWKIAFSPEELFKPKQEERREKVLRYMGLNFEKNLFVDISENQIIH